MTLTTLISGNYKRFLNLSAFFLTYLFAVSSLSAQPQPIKAILQTAQAPIIDMITPCVIKSGSTTTVTVEGSNLAEVNQLWLLINGVGQTIPIQNQAKNDKLVKVEIAVPAKLSVGPISMRLATPSAISAAKLLVVDELPVVEKSGQPISKETAQKITVPAVVYGACKLESSDFYRFSVKANETLSFEVLSRRIGSPFDPAIFIHDATRKRELPNLYCDDAPGMQGDCYLRHTFKEAGDYLIEIRDSTYQGGTKHQYVLRIGDFPRAITTYPTHAPRGQKVDFSWTGPDRAAILPNSLQIPNEQTKGSLLVNPRTKSGISGWPVETRITDKMEILEKEPNNRFEEAQEIKLPCGLSGGFFEKGDTDFYRFHANKAQTYRFQADTASINSPADVLLTIFDAQRKVVAKSNPQNATAIVQFAPGADGDYYLQVEHLLYAFGANEVYHLQGGIVEPDWQIEVATEGLSILPDSEFLLPIAQIIRKDYAGLIELEILGPPGVSGKATYSATTATPPNSIAIWLPVQIQKSVPPGIYPLTILSSAMVAGKKITHLGKSSVLFRQNHFEINHIPQSLSTVFALQVLQPQPIVMQWKQPIPPLARGIDLAIPIEISRKANWDDPLSFAVFGLPPTFTATFSPVPAKATKTILTIKSTAASPLVPFRCLIQAKLNYQGKPYMFYSSTIPIQVIPPVDIVLKNKEWQWKAGKTETIVVEVQRHGYMGAIDLELKNAPIPKPIQLAIPAGKQTAELKLEIPPATKPIEKKDLLLQATLKDLGKQIVTSAPITIKILAAEPPKKNVPDKKK